MGWRGEEEGGKEGRSEVSFIASLALLSEIKKLTVDKPDKPLIW